MRNRLADHARLMLIAYALLTGGLAFAAGALAPESGLDPLGDFPWITAASLVAIGSLIAISGVWTAVGMYALVFWCFHFGLVAVLATGYVGVEDLSVWDLSWLLSPHAAEAAVVALGATFAFACGVSVVLACRRPALTHTIPVPTPEHPAHPYGTAGSILVFGGVAMWCAIVLVTGGLGGFFVSYGEYLQATSDYGALLGVIWLALGCGLVLSVTGTPGRFRTGAAAAFAVLSVIVLPMGLRGEVMFRGAAALVAAARCGRVLKPAKAVALLAALLLLIPIVREVRQTGLRGLPGAVLEPRIYEAFAEMGASLHPVEKVVRWRAQGEPLEYGQSYWAPIERAAARLLPGLTSVAAEDDLRIANVLVSDRVGAIGYSPVAEAYRNFGPLGVVLVFAVIGAGVAFIDRIRVRRAAVLALAIVYGPLLVNIRNSFVSVPAHCAFGIALILALAAVRHVLTSIAGSPYARPAYIRSQV
jgi:hypothetical protein